MKHNKQSSSNQIGIVFSDIFYRLERIFFAVNIGAGWDRDEEYNGMRYDEAWVVVSLCSLLSTSHNLKVAIELRLSIMIFLKVTPLSNRKLRDNFISM